MKFFHIVAVHVWFWISVLANETFCCRQKNFLIILKFFLTIFVSAEKSLEKFEIFQKLSLKMSCRNPIVDDCIHNDTQNYSKNFANENLMIQVTGQTIKRLQKFTEKTITHQNLCAMHVTQIVLKWVIFFRNEWILNQFQWNFK